MKKGGRKREKEKERYTGPKMGVENVRKKEADGGLLVRAFFFAVVGLWGSCFLVFVLLSVPRN